MNWSHAGLRPHYPAHGESHRKTQMHTDSIRCGSATPWSDLRPGGARPVDEGNAADQSGLLVYAVLICSILLIRRGVPRQVARGRMVRVIPCVSVAVCSRAARAAGRA
jgi:hypothetical protein